MGDIPASTSSSFLSYIADANTGRYRPCRPHCQSTDDHKLDLGGTHSVGFSCQVEWTALKFGEVLKEDRHEDSDVVSRLQRRCLSYSSASTSGNISIMQNNWTHHWRTVVDIGKSNASRLINEEDVRVLVPSKLEALGRVGPRHPAWTWVRAVR